MGEMRLSQMGQIAKQFWADIPHHGIYPDLDTYMIMPNHLYGIVIINNPNASCRDVACNVSTPSSGQNHDPVQRQISG